MDLKIEMDLMYEIQMDLMQRIYGYRWIDIASGYVSDVADTNSSGIYCLTILKYKYFQTVIYLCQINSYNKYNTTVF